MTTETQSPATLHRYAPRLTPNPKTGRNEYDGMAASPDGRYVLFTTHTEVVENHDMFVGNVRAALGKHYDEEAGLVCSIAMLAAELDAKRAALLPSAADEPVATVTVIQGNDGEVAPHCVMVTDAYEAWLDAQPFGTVHRLYARPASARPSAGVGEVVWPVAADVLAALRRFVADAESVDLGGGDAVVTTCESLELAKAALSSVAPAAEGVPQVLRDAHAEAVKWSPNSFTGAEAIRTFRVLAGDYVGRLIDEAAQPEAT